MTTADVGMLSVIRRRAGDELFSAGDTLCRLYVREGIVDIDDEHLCHQVVATFVCDVPGCVEVFTSLLEFEMHYQQRHRFVCSECRKPLPSAHLLDLHLSETHDSFFAAQAQRKPMFRCFVEDCSLLSEDESSRRAHCIQDHNFPHDFRYDKKGKTAKDGSKAVSKSEDKLPRAPKHFSFGSSRGRRFTKPWHQQARPGHSGSEAGSHQQARPGHTGSEAGSSLSTSELMDTLPTL